MIFISYKQGEGSFYAKSIAHRLEGWGSECFYCERNCKTADKANRNWWDEVVAPVIETATSMVLIVTAGVFDANQQEVNHYVWREIKYIESTNAKAFINNLVVLIDNETISMEKARSQMPSWLKVLKINSQFIFTDGDINAAIDEVCARIAHREGIDDKIGDASCLEREGMEVKKFKGGANMLVLPRLYKSIGDLAFFDSTEIQSLCMQGTSIDTIGQSAFSGCTQLREVKLPLTLRRVKRYAFKGAPCAVTAGGITVVDGTLLTECTAGGDIVLPDSVTCIADEAFAFNFDITSISGAGVRFVGENAFVGCKNLEKKDFPVAEKHF